MHVTHSTILLTMKNDEELEADAKVSLEAIELGTGTLSFCDNDDEAVPREDVISDFSPVVVVVVLVVVAVVEGAATICLTLVVVGSARRPGGNSELEISIMDES